MLNIASIFCHKVKKEENAGMKMKDEEGNPQVKAEAEIQRGETERKLLVVWHFRSRFDAGPLRRKCEFRPVDKP